jgi:hypothetical protein
MPPHHISFYVREINERRQRRPRSIAGSNSRRSAMSEISTGMHHEAGRYEIRLKGHLDSRWAAWFDGLTLTNENDGTTLIQGPIADQAALHGLLQKVRDVGLPLVSVTQVDPGQPTVSTTDAAPTTQPR